MKLLIGLLLYMIPFLVLGWSIAFNQPAKKIIRNTLLTALIFGIILQSLFEYHTQVPGSGIILIVLVVISSLIALIIYFGFNFIYKKYHSRNRDNS